ncbi:FtsW/RodA/SpoVE family cell cycle protein [Pseudoclavibacter soli]|uniref:FtsW/RodA/SpoVE family cell cycle protein n=1 Tax=Pseudoclavibacter soli TaxID=452623 RepID=UPI000416989A|nr:FtsW/RodA/SpoVE family cell cycle protein [Pseudoclavibacter soli]
MSRRTTTHRLVERNLRGIELWLLILGGLVAGTALVAVQLGARGSLSPAAFVVGGVYWAAVIGLHVVLRITASKSDPIIVPIAAVLNGIGLVAIYRIDIAQDATGSGSSSTRQAIWSIGAVILAALVVWFLRNHRILQRYTYLFMLISVVLLVLPMIPGIGTDNGTNASLWAKIGPITFQPSEYAKISLAIFFAGYLVTHADTLTLAGHRFAGMTFPRLRDSGPILTVWAMAMLVLVVQKDLGTSLLYFGLFLVMLYVATGMASWVVLGMVLFGLGGLAAYRFMPLVQGRIHAWLHPLDTDLYNQTGGSYQLVQGLFGQAHGGLFGTGLGRGYPQLTPLSRSDYIYTSIAEEIGLIGMFALLLLFLLLISRGLRVGFAAQDDFGKLLATGLSFVLCLQVFIVIGGVTRVIPLTGLPTPFLAAGGSSLLANWVIVALLLRITDSIRSQANALVSTGQEVRS